MIDTRFPPARSIGVDREGRLVMHVSLKGDFIGVILRDKRSPAAVAVEGGYLPALKIIKPLKERGTKKTQRRVRLAIFQARTSCG